VPHSCVVCKSMIFDDLGSTPVLYTKGCLIGQQEEHHFDASNKVARQSADGTNVGIKQMHAK